MGLQSLPVAFGVDAAKWICVASIDATQLAVAAGVPSVGVFGPSDETVRGPWKGASLRGPRTLEEFKAIDPRLNQAIQHMMDLPYERVLKAARKLLAERSA